MENKTNTTTTEKKTRPPVVVVMGHIDHGKTKLLDYIRKTNVIEEESGGITQHIGAYQIDYKGHAITFLDTPGHEAYSAMRSRGAKVADIAILVIAADEGVKPQTEEAIKHIKEAKIPFVVAINKIDKANIETNKVKKELAERDVLIEELGGKIPTQEISAKTGQGVSELLELVLILAELEELTLKTGRAAKGTVIESYLDPQQGPIATIIFKEGVLEKNQCLRCGQIFGKVKAICDFRNNSIEKAEPSLPVQVLGLSNVPAVGDKCLVESEETAKEQCESIRLKSENGKIQQPQEGKTADKAFKIILKFDVQGSKEAIEKSIQETEKPDGVMLDIKKSEIGDINENDIKMAELSDSAIFGFKVRCPHNIKGLADKGNITIRQFDVIYDLVDEIKKGLSDLKEPEIIKKDVGKVKILAIFKKSKQEMIVGGKVTSGKIIKSKNVEIIRNSEVIGKGKITQLQKNKQNADEARQGEECGILFSGKTAIEEGDYLQIYEEEIKNNTQ